MGILRKRYWIVEKCHEKRNRNVNKRCELLKEPLFLDTLPVFHTVFGHLRGVLSL